MFTCARRQLWPTLAFAALLVAVWCALAPSLAAADACPDTEDSYLGNCGPTFQVPNWSDAGGWDDPSQYSTIQLSDLNGDGKDELIGRSDAGVAIFWFDATLGQWRPQVDANGHPQVLVEFGSFPLSMKGDPHNPNQPQFYSTIQAADIDGQPGAEILGRFWDGMRVYKYTPPAGSNQIDGGSWAKIGSGGPFSDADGYADPSLYSTIQVGQFWQGDTPLLLARKHSKWHYDEPSLAFYVWQNGAWSGPIKYLPYGNEISGLADQECGQPSCYLTLQTANNVVPPDPWAGHDSASQTMRRGVELLSRGYGTQVWDYSARGGGNGGWFYRDGSGFYDDQSPEGQNPPFADFPSRDCPFSTAGASGLGSGDCLGAAPAYYETMQAADIDGLPGNQDELLARASDGLRVYGWTPDGVQGRGTFVRRPTLTALAGAAGVFSAANANGAWGSIRTGNIDGQGGDEVLSLDGTGLQAYSYDSASGAWRQLPASPALALGSDPWLSQPEHYSTIQVGDVDGDGRDDVIARGPYGIRTWFYDRRGTGGWERYLAEGYPNFTGNQQTAYDKLNDVYRNALRRTGTIRDVWTQENRPDSEFLGDLPANLVTQNIGNCSSANGNQTSLDPPQYKSCTPPQNATGFSQDDWTAVVNEMLAESDAAGEVVAFFDELERIQDSVFILENAELPGIGDKLGLQQAAASQAEFNPQELWSLMFGIAGELSFLGDETVPLGVALSITAELLGANVSASPAAMASPFQSSYAGLKDQFAQMVSDADRKLPVQSQLVRQDAGLLGLVGQLRSSGAWTLDAIGMKSAAQQGFAVWVYEALMPTLYDRYQITNCYDHGDSGSGVFECRPPTGLGVIGAGQNFTMIGPQHQIDQFTAEQVPCRTTQGYDTQCTWNLPPNDLMNRIWGPLSSDCDYIPGRSDTAWHYGCSAGVDVGASIADNSWGFPSYAGDPDPYYAPGGFTSSLAAARGARVRPRWPIVLGRPRHGRRRAMPGRALFDVDIGVPDGLRLAGATVRLNRLLRERRGHGELTLAGGPRPLSVRLRRIAPGRFAAATTGRRGVRVALRRAERPGRARLTLKLGAPTFRAPRACHALPASVALDTPPLHLESRLVISDGRKRRRILVEHHVRCVRDAHGNISRLVYVRNRPHRLRPGLALRLRGPRRVEPGSSARYVARVRNRRRAGGDRLLSSLWDVTLASGASGASRVTRMAGGPRPTRIRELRAGRSRRLVITVRVPRAAKGRFCTSAVATAPGARADGARACTRVRRS